MRNFTKIQQANYPLNGIQHQPFKKNQLVFPKTLNSSFLCNWRFRGTSCVDVARRSEGFLAENRFDRRICTRSASEHTNDDDLYQERLLPKRNRSYLPVWVLHRAQFIVEQWRQYIGQHGNRRTADQVQHPSEVWHAES